MRDGAKIGNPILPLPHVKGLTKKHKDVFEQQYDHG